MAPRKQTWAESAERLSSCSQRMCELFGRVHSVRTDAATPAKRLRVRGGYAATPQRSARPSSGALDQAMVGLQAAERAITELQAIIGVRPSLQPRVGSSALRRWGRVQPAAMISCKSTDLRM